MRDKVAAFATVRCNIWNMSLIKRNKIHMSSVCSAKRSKARKQISLWHRVKAYSGYELFWSWIRCVGFIQRPLFFLVEHSFDIDFTLTGVWLWEKKSILCLLYFISHHILETNFFMRNLFLISRSDDLRYSSYTKPYT